MFSTGAARIRVLLDKFMEQRSEPVLQLLPLKEFKAKNPEIPVLMDYSKLASNEWWGYWPSLTWEEGIKIKSEINPSKMIKWADRADHPDMAMVLEIAEDLRRGCDIGTRGEFLCPSYSSNAPSAYEYGNRVTDCIVQGIKDGIMIGPMDKKDIPFPKDVGVKINGIMVKLKENGSARVILNMSLGNPFCVNDGMTNEVRFDVSMSDTKMWLRSLHKAGRGCWMCKLDWSGAYKQLRTQKADVRQQFFEWCGKYFAELCLVFGGSSSVGLYDRLAKVFKYSATQLSMIPGDQVQQIIDDVVGCGTKRQVNSFYHKYREIAGDCGIKLAPEDDPSKAFPASRTGEVFGINYCTLTWSWWLGERKLGVVINMLLKMEESSIHSLRFVKTVVGKLIHLRLLVPQGKYHLGQLIRMSKAGPDEDLGREIQLSDWARAEAWYWRCLLPFCARKVVLPNPDFCHPPWALHAYTDAAGGSIDNLGRGVGAVIAPDWWCYLPWGSVINSTYKKFDDGKLFKNKMSAWELVGPLLVLTAGVERVKNRRLVVPVDNAGSVAIYNKGWCTSCMLSTTVALAISEVAASINCQLEIVKITRCSNALAEAADAVSKADFYKMRRLMPGASIGPARVPRALLVWVNNPVEDRNLGARILREMGVERNILGYQGAFS